MQTKKKHIIMPKKSDAKKKTDASNSKTKSKFSKQGLKKDLNEFGDNDSF
ncbi:hypothetical protein [Flavobacterium sp.]